MSEMIERAAMAIWIALDPKERTETDWRDLPGREVSEVGTKAVMLEAARAAIASMREPTGNVDCAGCMVIFKKRFEPVSVVEISTPAWQAMIDEILK